MHLGIDSYGEVNNIALIGSKLYVRQDVSCITCRIVIHTVVNVGYAVRIGSICIKVCYTRRRKLCVALDLCEINSLQKLLCVILRASRVNGINKQIGSGLLSKNSISFARNGSHLVGCVIKRPVGVNSNRVLIIYGMIYHRSRRNSVAVSTAYNGSGIGSVLRALGNSEVLKNDLCVSDSAEAEVAGMRCRCVIVIYVVGFPCYAQFGVLPGSAGKEHFNANVFLIRVDRRLRVTVEHSAYAGSTSRI